MKRVDSYVALNPNAICGAAKYSVGAMYGFRTYSGDIIHVAATLGPCVINTYFSISVSFTNKSAVKLNVLDPEYSVKNGNTTVTTTVTDYAKTRTYGGTLPSVLDFAVKFCMTLVTDKMFSYIESHASRDEAATYRVAYTKPTLPEGEISVNHIHLLVHGGSEDETDALKKKNESLAAQLACATSEVTKLKSEVHQAVQERLSAVAERNGMQKKLTDAKEENELLVCKNARLEQFKNFALSGEPEAIHKARDARREADSFRVEAECAKRTAEAYRLEAEALRQQNQRLVAENKGLVAEMDALKGLSELGKRSRTGP